ncbi:hypothetical protein Goari_003253 [Gossypium aridum]|uniref:Ribulose bisphosphate carboxylase large chain n=1 Tax=Gossypium aridum TaxID=34290 RepID=A0A7J8YAX7_GOSAI|nr:hypothetical protein [Gossypium aridum]
MRGTPGYMAPEWLSSIITEKVDVYSFGIVVLEILCRRRIIDESQQNERYLLELFRRKQEEGQLLDLVDKCNDMQSNVAEVVEMLKVAAWCLQTEYANRPSMSTLVKHFEGSADAVINVNEDFQNELTTQAPAESFASSITPSVLSGPRSICVCLPLVTTNSIKLVLKEYKLTYYTQYEVKDTDILATFRVTPQLRVPLEEAEATVAAESFTGTRIIVQTDGFINLDRY